MLAVNYFQSCSLFSCLLSKVVSAHVSPVSQSVMSINHFKKQTYMYVQCTLYKEYVAEKLLFESNWNKKNQTFLGGSINNTPEIPIVSKI